MIRRHLTPLLIAVVASTASPPGMGLVFAAPASEPEDQSEPGEGQGARVNLEVDTSGTGGGGPVIQRRIEERGNVVLRGNSILPGDHTSPRLRLVVVEVTGDSPGFELEISLWSAGTTEPESTRVVACSLCTEGELVAKAEAEIQRSVPRVQALAASRETDETAETAETAETQTKPKPPPSGETSPPTGPNDTKRPGRGHLGAGIALLAVGAAGVGTGLGLMFAEPKVDPDDPLYVTSTAKPGYGVLAGGGAALIVGAILTGLGARKGRHAVSVAPSLGPGRAALFVGGSF